MSVVVEATGRSLGNVTFGLCKGAPEDILSLCHELPSNDWRSVLKHCYSSGYRVLAFGTKKIGGSEFQHRSEVESELDFGGFLVFENRLKKYSPSTVGSLKNAGIRCIMCTGDNVLTASSAARSVLIQESELTESFEVVKLQDGFYLKKIGSDRVEFPLSNLVSHSKRSFNLSCEGWVLDHLCSSKAFQHELEILLSCCNVFARMNPFQKRTLIRELRRQGASVGFCGDGANDCFSLKAADVGLSLSDTETSLAAPFSTPRYEVDCACDLLREGKASMISIVGAFKFVILYSIIQFTSTIMLFLENAFGDFHYLFIDLFLIIPMCFCMTQIPASNSLCRESPPKTLFSSRILLSIMLHSINQLLFVYVFRAHFLCQMCDCEETSIVSAVFLVSNFFYSNVGFAFSDGHPFRQSPLRSLAFSSVLIFTYSCSFALVFVNSPILLDLFELEILPNPMRRSIVQVGVTHFLVSLMTEKGITALFGRVKFF
eukprot:TRINITY_DN23323_c0_g1_i2.p1 TRINITY_DN23323_c0_g1~~TRINITY_DN23323_c0_g1_i2.p1  ORF type:complete len:500 (+),score=108.09 TRINITY_DN23323_c0_g1_i2:40-1500(+)